MRAIRVKLVKRPCCDDIDVDDQGRWAGSGWLRQAAAWERIATAIEKRDAKIIDHEHLLHTEGHHAIR